MKIRHLLPLIALCFVLPLHAETAPATPAAPVPAETTPEAPRPKAKTKTAKPKAKEAPKSDKTKHAAPKAKAKPIPFYGDVTAVDAAAGTFTIGMKTFVVTTESKIVNGEKAATLKELTVGHKVGGSYLDNKSVHEVARLNLGVKQKTTKPAAKTTTKPAAKPAPRTTLKAKTKN
jgi:hypothetical protein